MPSTGDQNIAGNDQPRETRTSRPQSSQSWTREGLTGSPEPGGLSPVEQGVRSEAMRILANIRATEASAQITTEAPSAELVSPATSTSERTLFQWAFGQDNKGASEGLQQILRQDDGLRAKVKAEGLKDAQIYIWRKLLDEEEVANLMKTGKVIKPPEILPGGCTEPEKVTFDSGIVGVFKYDKNYHL